MRPSWDLDASLADEADEGHVIDVAAAERHAQLAAAATVLAARCHVRLTERRERRAGVEVRVEHLRRYLHDRAGAAGSIGRRRVERAVEAARTGRPGHVTGVDLAALVDDLRIVESRLQNDPADH